MSADDAGRRLMEYADELNARVASCYERVACSKCDAAPGEACANVRSGAPLKHPHEERIRADGIALR